MQSINEPAIDEIYRRAKSVSYIIMKLTPPGLMETDNQAMALNIPYQPVAAQNLQKIIERLGKSQR